MAQQSTHSEPALAAPEFESAAAELDTPDLTGYEPFVTHKEFTIYRRPREPLYEYKVVGVLAGIDPATCLAVYTDHQYRRTWDEYIKDIRAIPDTDGGHYCRIAYPWPLAHRDYVYWMRTRLLGDGDTQVSVTIGRCHHHPAFAEVKGVVRVDSYAQTLVMRKASGGTLGTQVFMEYFDDPKGHIPSWLINWAAQKGVPAFLDQMHKACLNYPGRK
ncbi:hypothetical protein CAOG_08792 [Capsaspora owczarzaki ATCC 30864]|uniref:Phosphatidylcholine transfer protein n=1 Tax=Capsaspora owczarzaki (strain ATCC 30864) TaxID=595528 RepID=A0A0D2WRF4_CAPO3|nr:hypothetical protein CAOG_08792 [Capsaspora owczarzaki ATCC 30864]KJE93798.1 hypothetical protein CAOG_008792 [Capsaspora owczarzaki ATCC 30864]|eukprot:XP_011270432.1 hypothetical protein CAOG_08792 [Capsaspora owczarzaki ATCC 30864]